MLLLLFIITNIFSFDINNIKPKIVFKLDIKIANTNKDIFAMSINKNKFFIPAQSSVKILNPKIIEWYKIFRTQNSKAIYVDAKYTKIKNNKLYIKTASPFYRFPITSLPSSGSFKGYESFDYFSELNIPMYKILFKKKIFWIEAKYLTINVNFKSKFYEKIPIAIVSKLKGKSFTSKNIDRLVYMTTKYGVLISKNTKSWYRLNKLKQKSYKIALTNEGCLLSNNKYSCDFGKSFKELFPSYAIPNKNSKVNELLFSPNGLNFILLSFKDNKNKKYTYIYNNKKTIWNCLYPTPKVKFKPLSKDDIVTEYQKYLSQKYKILEFNSVINNKIIYLSIKVKKDSKTLNITKTFKFNKSWSETQEKIIF